MIHPLVEQLRFARSEFRRGLQGLSEEDAMRRLLPMNCISWNVGHLAWQEQRYFLRFGQGKVLLPEIDRLYRYGADACTPSLAESLSAWGAITAAADPWLDTLTTAGLRSTVGGEGWIADKTFGSLMLRTVYHYWYHNGENQAIRQALGHTGLGEFVGDLDEEAPYRAE
jgi:hypothetical protein